MRYQISNYEYLKIRLAEINDDLSLPWDTYPCIPWDRGCRTWGYGTATIKGGLFAVHRLAYSIAFGPFDETKLICHRCDNPPCFRPIHLFLGGKLENSQDMWNKGRGPNQSNEKNGNSKVTANQVITMREMYFGGMTIMEISKRFSLSHSGASKIVHFRHWKNIPMETR